MLAALLITLIFSGCVEDPPAVVPEPPTETYPFYTKQLSAVKGTKDAPRDFSKILMDYVITTLDSASSAQWSGKWNAEIFENEKYYGKIKLLISHSASEDVVFANLSHGRENYSVATLNQTAYYNMNGTKRSYNGSLGGRELLTSVFPISPLSSDQKNLLRNAWILIPFSGDLLFGTNAGGKINEYVGNIDVTTLIKNIAGMSTTGSNSVAAGAINKINAMILAFINAAYDEELTQITSGTELPKIKAKTHLVTNIVGGTEMLKDIYIETEIDGQKGKLIHIEDFSLSDKIDEFGAKSSIGNTNSYTETFDDGYTALVDNLQNPELKNTFKFASDYFNTIKPLFID